MIAFAFFLGGVVFASFLEYWVHRLMHRALLLGKTHRDHHASGVGQGVLWEYWDYLKGGIFVMVPPFFISLEAGLGWLAGTNLYALFSAYAHQLQHENPARCFWMPMPTHYVHHKYNMWHYNFGLALDCWDRVFRTYKPVEWREGLDPAQAKRGLLDIRWW